MLLYFNDKKGDSMQGKKIKNPNMMTFVKWKEQYKIHNSLDIVSYLVDIIVLCYQIGSMTLCHKRYQKSKMTQSVNL